MVARQAHNLKVVGSNPTSAPIACRKGVINASDHSPQMGDKTDAEMVAVPTIRHCPASLHGLGIMRRIDSTRIT